MKPERRWGKEGFSVVVALDPPKGANTTDLIKAADLLKGRVEAALVSDAADAIMRMSSLPACTVLREHGLRPVLCINNRDRNRLAVQGDLLGAWAHGIRDVVLREGKDPSFGDHPMTRPVFDLSSAATAEMIAGLNQGQDMAGQPLAGGTGFWVGAHVEWLDSGDQVETAFREMAVLADKGVAGFISSPQFEIARTKDLVRRAKSLGVDVFVSTLLLKSVGMARYLNEVPGVSKVPDEVIRELAAAPVKARASVDIAAQFVRELEGVADGVVLMPVGWTHKLPELLEAIGR